MAPSILDEETVSAGTLIDAQRMELLAESNHEISKLAEGMVRLLSINRDDDFLIYHGMLARIQQLSELQFYALRLHGDSEDEAVKLWGDNAKTVSMERIYKGMLA